MIYGYKYKNYKIDGFNNEIMYFFEYLFKNEPSIYENEKMFRTKFQALIKASHKKFEPLLKELIDEYNKLDNSKKKKVRLAFKNNNQIEELCNKKLTPVQYSEFKSTFSDKLKAFFEKLWNEFPHNNDIEKEFGTVKEHFDEFTNAKHQQALICPFCGLSALKPSEGKYRDAYDHYLPKALYPFTAMNFKNLVPTCHDCNSDEKGYKPVIYHNQKRKNVFFPFDIKLKADNIQLEICPEEKYNKITKSTSLSKIKWNYVLKINKRNSPQIIEWENIYGIKRRSKERMPSMESVWFDWILKSYKESKEDGVLFEKFKGRRLKELKEAVITSEKGLMRYSYIKYLLEQEKIQDRFDLI